MFTNTITWADSTEWAFNNAETAMEEGNIGNKSVTGKICMTLEPEILWKFYTSH